MKNQVKHQLTQLHTTLDKEFKELSDIRNELIKSQKFEMADNIYNFERNIHNLMQCICTNLNELTGDNWHTDSIAVRNNNVD